MVETGTSSDWYSISIEVFFACTFMFDICKNPGQAVALDISAGVEAFGVSATLSVSTVFAYGPVSLIGIDFAYATGADLLNSGVELSAGVMWATTDMYFNSRDMRAYCDPNTYEGKVEKEKPWTLSSIPWDDDAWGWADDARR